MAERIPDQVAALRDRNGAKISAKRNAMGINYDTAMMILKPIIDLLYMNVRNSILKDKANFSSVEPADAENIHQTIVSTLRRLQGREISLRVVFGAAEASSPIAVDTITAIFGDDSQAKRSKFFRGVFNGTLKEQWFESFFGPNSPKLSIRSGRYGSKPAILLLNADGDKDYLQYHITVSPERIFEDPANGQELVRGYHFTNWFYGNGTNIKRNYFFNNGSISRSTNNAKTRRRNEKRFNDTAAVVAASAAATSAAGEDGISESAGPPKLTQKQREAENKRQKAELKAKKAEIEAKITKERQEEEERFLQDVLKERKAESSAASAASAASESSAASAAAAGGIFQDILSIISRKQSKTIYDYMNESQTIPELLFFTALAGAQPNVKAFFYKIMNPYHKRSDIAESIHDIISFMMNEDMFTANPPLRAYVRQVASNIYNTILSGSRITDIGDGIAFMKTIGLDWLFQDEMNKIRPPPKPKSKGGRRRTRRKAH